MTEDGQPQDSTPVAADDMIGSLVAQVRELSLRVAELEGELAAARRRIKVYEDFDLQVQDSLAAAFRAANQIRERARLTAESIAEEARAQRPPAASELDALRIERDALRRVIEDASSSVPSRATMSVASVPMSEMRTAATEALRGVFKELVDEIRASTPPAAEPAPQPAAVHTPAPSAARPESAPAPAAPVYEAQPAQRPVAHAPTPPASVPAADASAPYEPPQWSTPAAAPLAPYVAPPSTYNPPEAPMPRPWAVPPDAPPARSAVVEDVDVTPAAAAPAAPPIVTAPAPQAAPEPAAAEPWAAAPTEPVGEIQVVLSPISSFPRLVELERRLQGMPVVRTVYARDFRNGVATLAIGLRHPMTVDEFATSVTKLDYPRLRIVSTSGYVLELRIDTEASSIA